MTVTATTVLPSDEYRTLERTGTGWLLTELDGTVMDFDHAGRWLLSTTDRNGNAKTAVYSGTQLIEVHFPDGRREDFARHPDGKLASIMEVGRAPDSGQRRRQPLHCALPGRSAGGPDGHRTSYLQVSCTPDTAET